MSARAAFTLHKLPKPTVLRELAFFKGRPPFRRSFRWRVRLWLHPGKVGERSGTRAGCPSVNSTLWFSVVARFLLEKDLASARRASHAPAPRPRRRSRIRGTRLRPAPPLLAQAPRR